MLYTTNLKIKPNDRELLVQIEFEHEPADSSTNYPEQIYIISVHHDGTEITDYLSANMFYDMERELLKMKLSRDC